MCKQSYKKHLVVPSVGAVVGSSNLVSSSNFILHILDVSSRKVFGLLSAGEYKGIYLD